MVRALVGIILLCVTASTAFAAAISSDPKTVVIVLRGEIDDYNKNSLEKRFDEARALGAKTIILQIDTYGGLVTSGLEISHFLKRQNDLHIIGFIDEKAISAGAMIALACDEIVMAPGSVLGDCAPIALTSGGELQTMGAAERAKMESPILEDFSDSANRNGYDPLLTRSMVSYSVVVHWIENDHGQRQFVDEPTYQKLIQQGWKPVADVHDPVDGADTLLTVGSDLALKLGLAKAIESSPQSLASSRQLQIAETFAPSGGEAIIQLLSSATVRGLLTTIFLFTLYTSLSHPGHGAPEAIAISALAILVGVPLLTGYAQWWEILAILIGIMLIAFEIMVFPGHFISAIAGILLVMVGLTMTFVGKEPSGIPGVLPGLQGTYQSLRQGTVIVICGMISSLLLWFWLQRYLPRLPYFNRLILPAGVGGLATENVVAWPAIGSRGRAVTDLKPGGSAGFADPSIDDVRITNVVSDSGFVSAGTDVIVREVEGNRVLVRAAT
jgi:membrane-bound serine protease (ClpP class)